MRADPRVLHAREKPYLVSPSVLGFGGRWTTRILLALVGTGLLLIPSIATAGSMELDLHHPNGARAWGAVDAKCTDARVMLVPSAEAFTFHASRIAIETVQVWLNRTIVHKPAYSEDYLSAAERRHTTVLEPNGPVTLTVTAPAFIGPGESARLQATVQASNLSLQPIAMMHEVGRYWAVDAGIPQQYPMADAQTVSQVYADAWARLSGQAFLRVRQGLLAGPDWNYEIAAHERTESTSLEVAEWNRAVYTYWNVYVSDAVADLPNGHFLYCADMEVSVVGGWTALSAKGRAVVGDHTLGIDGKDVTLDGQLHVRSQVVTPPQGRGTMVSRVGGDVYAASLDYHTPLPTPAFPMKAVVSTVLLTGALLGALKLLLFTRLKKDALLDLEARRLTHEAILAEPGISFRALVTRTGLNENSLRYHIRILRAHGLVRMFKFQGEWHLTDAHQPVKKILAQTVIAHDRPVAVLLGWLGSQEQPVRNAVAMLRTQSGLSRTGSWKAIQRACKLELVTRDTRGREVFLRSRQS